MAVPLLLLAIGAVVAGYVGVPQAVGGGNQIERFLEPSFTVELPESAEQPAWMHYELKAGEPGAAAQERSTEIGLMGLATTVAAAGFAIAFVLFLRRRRAADSLARTFAPVYRLLLGKYHVDEAYDAAIVHPLVAGAERGLWKGVDAGLIDGAVNGVGRLVRSASGGLRLLQAGSVRAYAASLFLGVVLVVAYLIWR